MSESQQSPVSYPVHVARLPKNGMRVEIDAGEEQRVLLAAAHGLEAVRRFRAVLDVTAWKRDGVRVEGTVTADVVQACIVTLEPVQQTVDEAVSALFLPEGSKLAVPARLVEGEIILDPEGDDAPELYTGDTVDVGQLAEEFFALGIDPYPRKAGALLETGSPDEEQRGPLFEKLAALKKKL